MSRRNFQLMLDRLISGGSVKQILTLIGATVSVFLLIWGIATITGADSVGYVEGNERTGSLWQLYYYFVDPGNQMSMSPAASTAGRWIGAVMSFFGAIFLSGFLISTITNIMERRIDSCNEGFNYYKFKDHVVIIGSNAMILGLIRQLCKQGEKRIVVMTSQNVDALRSQIQAALSSPDMVKRVIVNYGRRDSEEYLSRVGVTRAKAVYIYGDDGEYDDIECYHDSLNVRSLTIIAKLCREAKRESKLPCNVSFDYLTTYHLFQYADLPKSISDYVAFRPFSFYEFWAQRVFVSGYSCESGVKYRPLDYRPITSRDSDEYVHLVIIGMSKMGQAMAQMAAHIAHFPNYRKRKTRITFIDSDAAEQMAQFRQHCGALFDLSHSTYIDAEAWSLCPDKPVGDFTHDYHIDLSTYGHLVEGLDGYDDITDKDFIDVEWCFINGSDSNEKVRELLCGFADDSHAVLTVAVCLNITHDSLRAAMHLPRVYYELDIPVLVQQRKTSAIVEALNGTDFECTSTRYRNLQPFGMTDDSYDLGLESLAAYSKRINYVYWHCDEAINNIDDGEANALWEKVPTTKRWSNIYSASSIPTKLRIIGHDIASGTDFTMTEEQIEMLSEVEHNRWDIEELMLGYRPVFKDEDTEIDADKSKKKQMKLTRRAHYDLRPYEGLKTDDKGKMVQIYDRVIIVNLSKIIATINKNAEDEG